MSRFVELGKRSTEISELVEELLSRYGARPYDEFSQVEAIRRGLRDGIMYTRDPRGIETLRDPRILARKILRYFRGQGPQPIGDCDDYTILFRSLLEFLGFETVSRSIGTVARNAYNHVFPMVRLSSGRWIGVEATTREYRPAGFTPRSTTISPLDMAGLAQEPQAPEEPGFRAPVKSWIQSTLRPLATEQVRPVSEAAVQEIKFGRWAFFGIAAAGFSGAFYFLSRVMASGRRRY